MMHDSKRSYIYWDGAEMAALAQLYADPSLNWIDPLKLATAKLDRAAHHVWFTPAICDSSREKQAQQALQKYLAARDVELRKVDAPSRETECSHCGHAAHDHKAATSLALTLGLLTDAVAARFDCAYLVTNELTQALISQHKALLPVTQQIIMLQFDAVALEAARLPRLVECGTGTKLQRPAIWNRPRWMVPTSETSLSESGV